MVWLVLVLGWLEGIKRGSLVGEGEVPGGMGKEVVVLVCEMPKEVGTGGRKGLW